MAHFINTAIESVLAQKYRNFEIIIVDDGSTDDTEVTVMKYDNEKIKYYRQKHSGLACARNHGIRKSNGKYIGLLDADDVWLPNRLSIEVPIMENNSDVGMVHANVIEIDKEGNTIGIPHKKYRPKSEKLALDLLLRKQHILCPTVLFRKRCLKRSGLFDENLTWLGVEDRDLWIRIAKFYKIEYINKALALYRIRKGSMSNNQTRMMKARYYIVDKYCPKNHVTNLFRQRMLSAIHFENADGLSWRGELRNSLKEYWKAIKIFPLSLSSYLNATKAIFKYLLINFNLYDNKKKAYK